MGTVFNGFSLGGGSSGGVEEITDCTWTWRTSAGYWITANNITDYDYVVLSLLPNGTDTSWRVPMNTFIPTDGTTVTCGWVYSQNPGSGHMYAQCNVRLYADSNGIYLSAMSMGFAAYSEPQFLALYGVKNG